MRPGHPPFIKGLSLSMALLLLRVSVAGAASLSPGSLAVLDPPMADPRMGAAWDSAVRSVSLDPLMLVKDRESVRRVLEDWSAAGRAVETAWRTADRATLEKVQALLERAWTAYYAFSFAQARDLLGRADALLATPGDSAFRARMTFEVSILRGMVRRAGGEKGYLEDFTRAAAMDPEGDLQPSRFSPETIAAFERAREGLRTRDPITLSVQGKPADAAVLLDGRPSGQGRGTEMAVFPGKHFLEARAAGYEPWSVTLDVTQWQGFSEEFQLVQSGPVGDPGIFFQERMQAGDRPYLRSLVRELDVDYVLIPEQGDGTLTAWVLDREGRTVATSVLWRSPGEPDDAAGRMRAVLQPLRQELGGPAQGLESQVTFPRAAVDPGEGDIEKEAGPAWKRYALLVGVLVLIGAAARSEDGGTRIEVTW